MEQLEIERKFLVVSDAYKEQAILKKRITQGFLNTHPERTVRVRVSGEEGFLTIKGKSNKKGTARFEWERQINKEEALTLMHLCEPGVIDKYRYQINAGNKVFEVDEFMGDNQGLVVAEIELVHENEAFIKPDWLGTEVTGKVEYYNSQLAKNPYSQWKP